jgi:hypothetical protein
MRLEKTASLVRVRKLTTDCFDMTLCANSSHLPATIEQLMMSHILQLFSHGGVRGLVLTFRICLCLLYVI